MATKPRKGGGELFYVDEDGNKQDRELHEEILGEKIDMDRLLPEGPPTPDQKRKHEG